MKLFLVGLVASVFAFFFQQAVRTENASNLGKNYTAATTGDTVFTKAAQATGGGVDHVGVTGYLVGLSFNTTVDADSIEIKNGAGSVAHFIFGTAPDYPVFVPLNVRLDTSLIYIQKKTSNVTLVFRTTPN